MDSCRGGQTMMRRGFTMIELLTVVAVIAIMAAIAVPNFLDAQTRSKLGRAVHDMAIVEASLHAYYADHMRYPPNTAAVQEWMILSTTPGFEEVAAPGSSRDAAADKLDILIRDELQMEPMMEQREERIGTEQSSSDSSSQFFPALHPGESALLASARSDVFQSVDPSNPTHWNYFYLSRHDLNAVTTPVAYFSGILPEDVFDRINNAPFVYLNYSEIADAVGSENLPGNGARYLLLSSGPDGIDPGTRSRDDASIRNPTQGPFVRYDPTNGTMSGGDLFTLGGDIVDR